MPKNPRSAEPNAKILDPYRYYESPMDVVRSTDISRSEKLSILRAMEADARLLEVATEENMTGGEKHALSEVLEAQRALDPDIRDERSGVT